MYTKKDIERESLVEIADGFDVEEYRTPWRRDYARLIHSPSFRRLQGKTQLYPGLESDFFRNRLTHSLEVAQIAKSLALRLNHSLSDNEMKKYFIQPDICEFAGLAHDLGHPPFGHQGEDALDHCMKEVGGFEGNAQTLRILTRIEKKIKSQSITSGKEYRFGLGLCYRSLASILKYDRVIPKDFNARPDKFKDGPVKGFYKSEERLVKEIKDKVVGKKFDGIFKTVECGIMDIADDIAYSTYDLEDGLKAGFFNPIDWLIASDDVYEKVARKVSESIKKPFTIQEVKEVIADLFNEIFDFELDPTSKPIQSLSTEDFKELSIALTTIYQTRARNLATDGYLRNDFTSKLIGKFIRGINIEYNDEYPALSKPFLTKDILVKVEVLKHYTFESQVQSPRLKIAEYRGKEIVGTIFDVVSKDNNWQLMPTDYQDLYQHFTKKEEKARTICDFISGMTDKYAIEFYGRLKSENPQTIFKPF